MPPVWVLLSGCRCSGKDSAADYLPLLYPLAVHRRTSFALKVKEEFCRDHGLDLPRMLTDRDYKELHRPGLIAHAMEKRRHDADHWVAAAYAEFADLADGIVVVTDYRFANERRYLEQRGLRVVHIAVAASDETRRQRGWRYTEGVDDAESETNAPGLIDDATFIVENNGDRTQLLENMTSVRLAA